MWACAQAKGDSGLALAGPVGPDAGAVAAGYVHHLRARVHGGAVAGPGAVARHGLPRALRLSWPQDRAAGRLHKRVVDQ